MAEAKFGRDRGEPFDRDPVIFVHGGSGSASQFSAQAQRFASNGYPDAWLAAVEYDSGNLDFPDDLPVVFAELDAVITALQEETGREQVVLMGHSRGTTVSQAYLEDPARAANVSSYVNIDGRPAEALPGGVPTLALWAGAVDREVPRVVVGGVNVTVPDQEHIEVAVSEESFAEIYRFINGEEPKTTKVIPQFGRRFEIEGKAVIFPDNVGVDGATVEIYRVSPFSGRRIGRQVASFSIDETGDFGPFRAKPFRYYEFVIVREGERDHHFFYEPFRRSDRFVRLNTSRPGEGISAFIPTSPASVAINVNRNVEYWGDRGGLNDSLLIDSAEVINEATAPSGFVGAPSTIFAFDEGLDGVSNVEMVPFPFPFIAFLAATDLFVEADADAPLSIISRPRFDSRTRFVTARKLPSDGARVTIQLRDY
ncbi:alpha/beta fold hydrolase [Parvularcula maris]|uniref:Alpha/beta fold hydrolase n=1 Tax=Parvularcula maris TaxID=2965077 RepID=A0A9X2LBJ5_9PROT|nr:alpha/beta fold hydrolase [Parvularcula maris]MCQ8186463.1 alpha/beta fold hydrolase [Parvularcula maris]